jgi:hypothetical protein
MNALVMKNKRSCLLVWGLFVATAISVPAQEGHWEITQLAITNVLPPSINNSGEIGNSMKLHPLILLCAASGRRVNSYVRTDA